MKRILLSLSTMFLCAAFCLAQGPNGSGTYYQDADGLTGEALKTKLFTIISQKTHSPNYDELIELYKITDTRADGCVRDWYSNITHFTHVVDKAGSYSKEGDVYNREHSVPQSWGAPKADIVHVIPTDGYVNNRRNNFPFGEVGNVTYQSANGYSKVGACKTAGYSGTVFEPNDEVKGDIARIYFYMATCYETTIASWSGGGVITGTKYQPYAQWTYDMMVRWSQLDPVDSVEIVRNNAIARTDVQGNRNPFVDYPGLEDYIWGSKTEVPFSYDNYDASGTIVLERVAQPVFSPDGGTFEDQVEVTITTDTEGATIYYTTNGAEASENSKVYDGPITLTATTTLRAIAVKDGMSKSFQTMATYTITSSGGGDTPGGETPTDATVIALNNALFGTSFSGSLTGSDQKTYTGTKNGITISYEKGTGSSMYINDEQLRLYQGNTLTVSTAAGQLTELEFTIVLNKGGKTLEASVGTSADGVWTGQAQSVTFNVNSGSGHLQLSQLKAKSSTPTAITDQIVNRQFENQQLFDLFGRPVSHPQKGVYIQNGRKILIK